MESYHNETLQIPHERTFYSTRTYSWKIQGHESQWETGDLFQTQGHEETSQINAIYGGEQDLSGIKKYDD